MGRITIAALYALLLAMWLNAGSSSATAIASVPAWKLQVTAQPTSFAATDTSRASCEKSPSPEFTSCDRYTVVVENVGTRSSNGAVTVVDTLPAGITTSRTPAGESNFGAFSWTCSTEEVAAHEVVSCVAGEAVQGLSAAPAIEIPVNDAALGGTAVNRAEVSGGGAGAPAAAETPTAIGGPELSFGVLEGTLGAAALDGSGMPATQAGAHPSSISVSFAFPSFYSFDGSSFAPFAVQDVKQIAIDLPAGVLGDVRAAPACSLADLNSLTGLGVNLCSAARVGTGVLIGAGHVETELALINVIPERGFAAELGIYDPVQQRSVLLYGKLVGAGADTHLRLLSAPVSQSIDAVGLSVIFYGDPAVADGGGGSPAAVFTNPSDCEAPGFTTAVHVDSWQQPARVEPDGQPDLSDPNWKEATSALPPVTGCEALQFHPDVGFVPETTEADSPSGYEMDVAVPQNEAAGGLATPPLRKAVVTLPPGVSISPPATDGLVVCQESGPEGIELQSPDAGHCPAASTVGSVEAVAPTLAEPLSGRIYVAKPGCGVSSQTPCGEAAVEMGEAFALYLEVGSETSGVHLKLKGVIEVGGEGNQGAKHNDLQPGQLRVTFADMPQQALSELTLEFSGGPRALLASPQTCGDFAVTAALEPWSHRPGPGEASGTPDVMATPSLSVTGCGERFAPAFSAGTTNPRAGAYSPLTLTFSRQDREQGLSGATMRMAPGLLARLAGVPLCSEANANDGTCPAASRIGSATTAIGSGPDPLWQAGSVYLTGPFNGGPFGLSVVLPASIGPFELGSIVVRAAIRIDPTTAQMTLVTNPFPQSVEGLPLRLKTVNLTIERPGFIINPTSCNPLAITGTISGIQGAAVPVRSRFQVGDCATLPFKPVLTAGTRANGEFSGHGASLHVVIRTTPGQANIRALKVDLPQRLPARLGAIQHACPARTFAANPATCPGASVIGSAAAATPVLDAPMRGPIYLVSHGGGAFPDMVLVLQAQGVRIDLTGRMFVNRADITSTAFRAIPDVPIRRLDLTLPEGRRSILAASANLCKKALHMSTAFTAQDGARAKRNVIVAVAGCRRRAFRWR